MKKIIFTIALIPGSYLLVNAQSSTGQGSKNTTQVSGTSKKSKRIKNRQVVITDTGIYNRKEHKSKKNGAGCNTYRSGSNGH